VLWQWDAVEVEVEAAIAAVEEAQESAAAASFATASSAPSAPPSTVSRRGVGALAEYRSWTARPLPSAEVADVEVMAEALVEIVTAEGPMLAETAYRRYAKASGATRLGSATKRSLNSVSTRLIRRGRLMAISDGTVGQIGLTFYAPVTPAVVVRELGERGLAEVPRSEVRELMRHLGVKADDADAKRLVLQAYGRVALTRAADEFLESCLGYSWTVEDGAVVR